MCKILSLELHNCVPCRKQCFPHLIIGQWIKCIRFEVIVNIIRDVYVRSLVKCTKQLVLNNTLFLNLKNTLNII